MDLRRAVDQACAQWQCAPDGVLHLAGVYREGLLTDETRESLAATLRPKVLGTWALYQLVKDRPGALFVHFSSVMGFFGGAMFGAYAAANRFLDNFAHLQRSVELRPQFREDARRDGDFDAVRDDPRFEQALR